MRVALLIACTLAAAAAPALAAPAEPSKVRELVPRLLTFSVGNDHAFVSLLARVEAADLGLADWSRFDRDGSGAVEGTEKAALFAAVRTQQVQHLCVAVDGRVLSLMDRPVKLEEPAGDAVPLDAVLKLRISGRLPLELAPGEHRYLMYDESPAPSHMLAWRLSLVRGLRLELGAGGRAEAQDDRRAAGVMRARTPAFWGTFSRLP